VVCEKVKVLGWYNHSNIGDESYKLSFQKLFNNEFEFVDELLVSTDTAILGGGDVFGYIDQMNRAKKKLAVSICLPEKTKKSDLLLFDTICVRDSYSLNIAKSHNVEAYLYPDMAFLLNYNKEEGKNYLISKFSKNKLEKYSKIIGIVVNANLMPQYDTTAMQTQAWDNFCFSIANAIDCTNASFVFIPFGMETPRDDRVSNGFVASKCKFWKKNFVITEQLSVQEALNIISACDIMISTRLHSSIFSCIAGVPFLDITHNHKNAAFLNDIQYKHKISFWDFSKKEFDVVINNIEKSEQTIRGNLLSITENNINRLLGMKQYVHLL
jgi:polysaccharide pyruvyl transferase WcaK-like protein